VSVTRQANPTQQPAAAKKKWGRKSAVALARQAYEKGVADAVAGLAGVARRGAGGAADEISQAEFDRNLGPAGRAWRREHREEIERTLRNGRLSDRTNRAVANPGGVVGTRA
jgi:hypothetical protein